MQYDGLKAIRVSIARGVAWAAIDHPPMNLLDRALARDLSRLIDEFEADEGAQVLVLTSLHPEYFIAHADVTMLRDMAPVVMGEPGTPAPAYQALERLRLMSKVSIALVEGIARGGGFEIALACDLRYVSRSARLAQPEVALGIIPGAGGAQRLTRLVGRARALELVLTCRDMTGAEAAAMGYVNRVLEDAHAAHEVLNTAEQIASMPESAVAAAKRAITAANGELEQGYAARSTR